MRKRGYYIELARTDGKELEDMLPVDLMVESFVDGLKLLLDNQPAKGTLKLYKIDEPDMYITIKPEALFKEIG